MALELHVWGPAFGLESIDAECLAAITAFRHTLSRDDWTLVADNDTSISPDNCLPALFHSGACTSGYRNIISYLGKHARSSGQPLADDDLTPQQEADVLAYSAYLGTRGSGLVALSLYASPNAWVELTRPAYSTLLPFPLTWTIPTAIRAAAVEKAEHLGMGYLAAEAEADEAAAKVATETTPTGFMRIREKLGPRKSMQPEQTAAIRFQQLADDFFTTLDDLRGSKTYLLGTDEPSSLDFLAYGYLALMNVRTPYPILANSLVADGRNSMQFLQMMEKKTREYPILPQQIRPRGLPKTMAQFADGAVENLAGVGESWKRWRHGGIKPSEGEQVDNTAQVLLAVGGAITGLAAVGAALLFRALPPFGAPTHAFEPANDRKGLHRYGEIGAMLDSLPIFGQAAPSPSTSQPVTDTIYHKNNVDVAVDVDPGRIS
ncbi:hypothetical protein GGS20DRAFT_529014 [Poronia punctata]|nr:hypothetical protein GGS20DRAFT_529014 [Poronia punctata]